ncbi:type IV secretion system protein [Sporichthya polymorpha]|uniref:type IV secretion system protein n=1 Tax=Sporichthya polymorpha TaxID=35751 RepID=UPI000375CE04|nr:type IV secretion system protein [Sporichthya polymorpha]
MTAGNPACAGPLDPLCAAVGGVVGSATATGSGFVLDALGDAFVSAAESVTTTALAALDTGTRIDLGADWFRANVAVIAAVTVPVVMGLLVAQAITSVLRREPGGLARAAVGLAKALLGASLALGVTQAGLIATDGICEFIAASSGTTVHGAAERFLNLTWLAGPQVGPVLQMMLGIGIIFGCLALWAVLLFRKAALLLVAVFAPIAFAGAVWDQTRVWARRWIEIVAALVLCKVVIVVTFVLGASAFTGTGPTVAPPGTAPGTTPGALPGAVPDAAAAQSAGLSDVLVGLILLTIAAFAPWMTFKFVHWTGMEAASVMHSSMAANPASRAAGAAGSQARFAAQQAITSSVLAGAGAGGAGAAAAGRRAGPARNANAGGAPLAAGLSAHRPSNPRPGGTGRPTSRKDER